MINKHLIKSQQFTLKQIDELFALADTCKTYINVDFGHTNILNQMRPCSGLVMATLFYEPSTRTRFSFEAAMLKLGGSVISTENAENFSSTAKGEKLEDSIRTVASYSDLIVLRHPEEGAAEWATGFTDVPIINAGDGAGQHPTQALLDLYTIREECGGIDGKSVALIGDLFHSRTVHSLAYLLSKYKISHLYLVSPNFVKIKEDLLLHLAEGNFSISVVDNLKEVAPKADVFYQTRLQKERFRSTDFELYMKYQEHQDDFQINVNILNMMKPDARILHPLPRIDEIAPEVDSDPRAAYFRQVENGLYVRMAILITMLRGKMSYEF